MTPLTITVRQFCVAKLMLKLGKYYEFSTVRRKWVEPKPITLS